MRSSFQQNDLDDSAGSSLSRSFRKIGFEHRPRRRQVGSSTGQSFDGSFRKSKADSLQDDPDAFSAESLDGSFRKSKSGVCKGASGFLSSNKPTPISNRLFKTLKFYLKNVVDIDLFTQGLEDWVVENSTADSTNGEQLFNSPFQMDELRELDYALEGSFLRQIFRMPCSFHDAIDHKEDEYLALEDFLHTIRDGLWHTFWHRSTPSPFSVSCSRHPSSKFYSIEKAISRGRIAELSGAALILKSTEDPRVNWDQVVQFSLFKADIMLGNKLGISSATLCEALFYGFHILLSRKLSKYYTISGDFVFTLVLDSKFGAVVKLGGDLRQLDLNPDMPYESVVEWIKVHAEISVSPVDRIWNKLGNPNWGDLGTLQLLLATYYSIAQFHGPPRKSISSLAAAHSLRLQKRRIEYHMMENEIENPVDQTKPYGYQQGEIMELANDAENSASKHHTSHLTLREGDLIQVDDQRQGKISFQVQESLMEGTCLYYSAVSLENPHQLLTLYVGAHPSRLEPSWEDMSLWYQVQRQTKVLNILKQAGVSSKNLPEIVASGKILHPGDCKRRNPTERCDHPWCGTPVLVTFPVGDPLSLIIAQDGPFSAEETMRCCRDCILALRSAKMANILHGDICPENTLRVSDSQGSSSSFSYVPISWGRAVLEERDSPAINLLFSSSHALQHGKLCPSSDVESLVYLLYYLSGGIMQQQDSIESALQWRQRSWAKRHIQRHLGEISALLKAFADYVDTLCGTPYPVEYDGWIKRLDKAVNEVVEREQLIAQMSITYRSEEGVPSHQISEYGS
ncbi:hypothetical protein Droror1_Dr00002069 [Drosera rotundifolia]